MGNTLDRKILFYKIASKDNLLDLFDKIKNLNFVYKEDISFNFTGSRYYKQIRSGKETLLSLKLYNEDKNKIKYPIKAILGNTRRDNLPPQEIAGKTSSLGLDDDAGLYEATHFMIFKNNIVAVEFNNYAPRITSLKSYFMKKFKEKVDLYPIMVPDFDERIKNLVKLKLITIKVARNQHAYLNNFDLGVEAIDKLKEESPYDEVTINLKLKKDNNELNKIIELMKTAKNKVLGFKIKAININDKVEEFNLFSDLIRSKKSIVKLNEKSREISSVDMFDKLEEAYLEKEEDIQMYSDSLLRDKNEQERKD